MTDDHDRRPDEPQVGDRDGGAGRSGDGDGEVEILGFEALDEEGRESGEWQMVDEERPLPGIPVDVTEVGPDVADSPDAIEERYVRLLADFDNFRKRTERERETRARYAMTEPLRDLLPVLDNLQRALSTPSSGDDLRLGVEMIARQFVETLARYGVEKVPTVGEPFDPRFHDAMMRVESPDVAVPTVVEELQRGYLLHDRLLRPAMVRVAMPVGGAEAAASDSTE